MNQITHTIGGNAYRLMKLDAVKAGRIALRAGALLAAAVEGTAVIQTLIDAYKANQAGAETSGFAATLTDTPKLLDALAGGIAKLDAEALYDLALQCVRGQVFTASSKLNDDDAISAWFESHPADLYPVLAWALKENCAGFFGIGGKV